MSFRGMEGVRVHAMQLYLGLASKRGDIAQDWIKAISGGEAALYNFIERWGDPTYEEPDPEEEAALLKAAERIAREGLDWKGKDVKSN